MPILEVPFSRWRKPWKRDEKVKIRAKNREVAILVIVSMMALAANLPDGSIGNIVDRNLLLSTLAITVFISLFRYLKFMLFLTVSVLAIGANLPDQFANQLGISRLAMIVASGVLVVVALLYKSYYSKPREEFDESTEDTKTTRHDTLDTRKDIITAILNGNIASLHQLLISGVEINFSQNGLIPLFLAIERGYADIVLLLLFQGAKLRIKNKEGLTPIEFALLHEKLHIARIINYTSQQNLTIQNETTFPVRQKGKMVILFADICGSTALYDKLGNDVALHVITRVLNVLIQEVVKHKGTLIKTIGDEIMCSFPSITLAAQAASAMHFAVDVRRPGGEHSIHVRIGFHYGDVIRQANDVFGDTVNIAARVTAITRARQTMTTQAVIDSLPPEFTDKVRPVMRTAFRGKQNAFAVFQLLWEPENTVVGRIGQSAFRKPNEGSNELFGDDQTDLLDRQLIELSELEAANLEQPPRQVQIH
jgi:class 3 adenylate cyclase